MSARESEKSNSKSLSPERQDKGKVKELANENEKKSEKTSKEGKPNPENTKGAIDYPTLPGHHDQSLIPSAPKGELVLKNKMTDDEKSREEKRLQKSEIKRILNCNPNDWYDILGVKSNVDPEIRQHKWSSLLKILHPDKSLVKNKDEATAALQSEIQKSI